MILAHVVVHLLVIFVNVIFANAVCVLLCISLYCIVVQYMHMRFCYIYFNIQRYEGWCGVSYYEREMNEFAAGDSRVRYPGDPQYYRLHGEFEEYVEIDKEEGKYEKIDVPKFADIQRATILHDFDKVGVLFSLKHERIVGSPPKHFGDWCSHTSGSEFISNETKSSWR